MATIEQILGHRNLTGVIQLIKSGIPNPLPPAFFNVGRKVSGNTAEYYRVNGTRRLARAAQYGSPASRRELTGVDLIPVKLLHFYESQQWPLTLMINITKMTDLERDKMGQQQAELQSTQFKQRFSNARIAATMMALFNGIIYVDSNGEILPSSSGSAYSASFSMPAGNQNQLGGTISTTWANTSANIITQLLNLKTKAVRTTGYEIKHAFYGDNVPGYIATNVAAQAYLARNPGMNQQYLDTGLVPAGFGGIANWHSAGSAFFVDKNEAIQGILGADGVTFTPEPSADWWEIIEGSFPVPTTVVPQMGSDAASMLASVQEAFGMFGYGLLTLNPPTVEQFAGDTWLPTLKNPSAIWQATVAF